MDNEDRNSGPDLSKQYHIMGTNNVVLKTADSKEEADEIIADFHRAKAKEMERVQLFLEHPSPTIRNMGTKHPTVAKPESVEVSLEELQHVPTKPPPSPVMNDRPKPPDPTPPAEEVTRTTDPV